MIGERDDVVALDSAILQHPRTWEASGHLEGFTDPLVDCRTCKLRFRADDLENAACGKKPSKQPGRDRRVRPHRRAPVQPHVRDPHGPGARRRLDRLPAPRDGPGDLRQLQERAPVRAPQAAVRDRAGRKVVSQRDHARELRLSHARVRADGDGVLRAPGRGRQVVRVLARRARALVHRPRDPPRPPAPARAPVGGALALLLGDVGHRVPVPDRLVGARGRSPTAATSTSAGTRSSRARSSSTSTRRAASATSRT